MREERKLNLHSLTIAIAVASRLNRTFVGLANNGRSVIEVLVVGHIISALGYCQEGDSWARPRLLRMTGFLLKLGGLLMKNSCLEVFVSMLNSSVACLNQLWRKKP